MNIGLSNNNRDEDSDLYCVKWTPSISGFHDFIHDYRKFINCPLGGSRQSRYIYTDPTIAKVLSVSSVDNRSALPQRVSLSNFKIGTPITSYGCIYRLSNPTESEYLLIRRNDSVSYIDIIRGNYRESQLYFMIQDLPENERERLLNYNFDTLWFDLHMKPPEGDAYKFARQTFDKMSPYFSQLFERVPSLDPDGKYLWLFPKGRPQWNIIVKEGMSPPNNIRNEPESPFECAIREFKEETNGIDLLGPNNKLLFSEPVVERYLGSNSKNYRTNYFVFGTSEKPEIKQFTEITTPIRQVSSGEVGNIRWVRYSELGDYLRTARLDLIKYIENNVPAETVSSINEYWKCPVKMDDFPIETPY